MAYPAPLLLHSIGLIWKDTIQGCKVGHWRVIFGDWLHNLLKFNLDIEWELINNFCGGFPPFQCIELWLSFWLQRLLLSPVTFWLFVYQDCHLHDIWARGARQRFEVNWPLDKSYSCMLYIPCCKELFTPLASQSQLVHFLPFISMLGINFCWLKSCYFFIS